MYGKPDKCGQKSETTACPAICKPGKIVKLGGGAR